MHAATGENVLVIASDKDTVRHINEQIRRERLSAGQLGDGHEFVTDGGRVNLHVNDRISFRENSVGKRGIGVLNGYIGTVREARPREIVVELDGDRGTVSFSPRRYTAWTLGYAGTVHTAQGASVDRCVAILDKSASAELAFVALSRAKVATTALYAETNFKDTQKIAEHLGRRISAKTTSQTYEEALAQHGGHDSVRVKHIDEARDALSHPLRRQYEAEMAERVEHRERAIADLRNTYAGRKREITTDRTKTLAERLRAQRELSSERRRATAAVIAAHRPEPFTAWLAMREEQRVQRAERTRERDHARERDLTSARGSANRSTCSLNPTLEVSNDNDHGLAR
jgi:hypothetical protein